MDAGNRGGRAEPYPRNRLLMVDGGRLGRRRHTVHGLVEFDVTNTRHAIRTHRAETGEMFFGGNGALVSFEPGKIAHTSFNPPIYVTELELYSPTAGTASHLFFPDHLNLSWRDKDLTFRFAALDFSKPEGIEYSFMLSGWDEEWRPSGKHHEIRYTNLPGGKYTFRIKSTSANGVWFPDASETALPITIGAHPAKSWWAISLYVLAGVSILTGFFFL